MTNQLPCLLLMLVIVIVTLAVGGFYTIKHPKQINLVSCYEKGGSCLELENCAASHQSRLLTTCVNKRKVCCMKNTQAKNLLDDEEFRIMPF